jgi:hypothetical protein
MTLGGAVEKTYDVVSALLSRHATT